MASTAALAAAVLVGACSSGGGSSNTSSNTSGATSAATNGAGTGGPGASAAATGSPVKVGVICSCSGPFGAVGEIGGKVAQAWVKSVNAAGGIGGHSVDLTFKDDTTNPGTSVTAVQSLVSDHVAVIVDLSQLPGAWAKIADNAKIPVVGGDITNPIYDQDPNFYPSGGTNAGMVLGDILVAKQAGVKKLGQLYCAESPQCQQSVAAHKTAGRKYGVPIVYNASIAATAPNYTAQCVAAKQAGVDGLFIGDIAAVYAHVAQDCAQQGYHPTFIEVGTGLTTELASTPALQNSLWISNPVLPYFANTAQVQKMNAAVDKYYPGLRKSKDWGQIGTLSWTAGLLVEKAVAGAGSDLTAAGITKALDSIKNETLDGWSPPLTLTAGKVHSVNCFFSARMQNGKLTVLNNSKPTCEKAAS